MEGRLAVIARTQTASRYWAERVFQWHGWEARKVAWMVRFG
jgi:hypothetical protein